jgi:hypothetical protein
MSTVGEFFSSSGNVFQIFGPATAKALSPKVTDRDEGKDESKNQHSKFQFDRS